MTPETAKKRCLLKRKIRREIKEFIEKRWGKTPHIEIEFEVKIKNGLEVPEAQKVP